jgi:hypothetical protein
MKIILEQTIFTICQSCGHVREHTAEVHSPIHFETYTLGHTWLDEFNDFVNFIGGKEYLNFHEAYLAYLNRRKNI